MRTSPSGDDVNFDCSILHATSDLRRAIPRSEKAPEVFDGSLYIPIYIYIHIYIYIYILYCIFNIFKTINNQPVSPRHVLHRKGTVAQNGATSILHAAVVPAEGATLDVRDGSPVVPHFGGMKIEFTINVCQKK